MKVTISAESAKHVQAIAKSKEISNDEAADDLIATGWSRKQALSKFNKRTRDGKPAKKKSTKAKKKAGAKKPSKKAPESHGSEPQIEEEGVSGGDEEIEIDES